MFKKSIVPIGWVLGIGFLVIVVFTVAKRQPPRWPSAALPDGSRLRITSSAFAAATNLSSPPHKLLGFWRTGLPYGFPVATMSGLPEFLVMFEREGPRIRNAGAFSGGTERMVLLDAQDQVASVGQMLSGFGSSGPLWETANKVFEFGSLTNQGPMLRLALQVPDSTHWKTLATLAVTNPVYRAGPASPADR